MASHRFILLSLSMWSLLLAAESRDASWTNQNDITVKVVYIKKTQAEGMAMAVKPGETKLIHHVGELARFDVRTETTGSYMWLDTIMIPPWGTGGQGQEGQEHYHFDLRYDMHRTTEIQAKIIEDAKAVNSPVNIKGLLVCSGRYGWKEAARALDPWVDSLDEADRRVFEAWRGRTLIDTRNLDERTPACYIDAAAAARTERASTLTASVRNYISDKAIFGRMVMKAGLENIASPPTFFSIQSAVDALSEPRYANVKLVFIKATRGAGGVGILPVKPENLAAAELAVGDQVVQFGVTEIQTWKERKYVVRAYLIVARGGVYLFDRAFAIVHGPKFDPASDDYRVQVSHAGYNDVGNDPIKARVQLLPLHTHVDNSAEVMAGIFQAAAAMHVKAFFDRMVTATQGNSDFLVLGVDAIPRTDGSAQFIEINAVPNTKHTVEVNEDVNDLALAAAYKLLAGFHDPALLPLPRQRLHAHQHEDL